MARPWTAWPAVLTILAVLTIGAVVPDLARAAGGRVLTPQDVVTIRVVNQLDMDTTAASKRMERSTSPMSAGSGLQG